MMAPEKGMLFSGPMIRALLNVRADIWPAKPIDADRPFKIQTRRAVDLTDADTFPWKLTHFDGSGAQFDGHRVTEYVKCPHPIGSVIYAKEKFGIAGNGAYFPDQCDGTVRHSWRSGRFMPKRYARLWFEVMDVRMQRVAEISANDAIAEGIDFQQHKCGCEVCSTQSALCPATQSSLIMDYAQLWDSINGSFDKNPWVWVYSLKRIRRAPRP